MATFFCIGKEKKNVSRLLVDFWSAFGFVCVRSMYHGKEYFGHDTTVHNSMFLGTKCIDRFILYSFHKKVFYAECQIIIFCVFLA